MGIFDNKGSGQRARMIIHIVMGLLYLGLGYLVITKRSFGTLALDKGVAYAMGALLLVYGGFRLWRAYYENKNARNKE